MIEGLDALKLPDSGKKVAPFFEGARTGRLLLPRCRSCGELHWYPRSICPFCLSDDMEWTEAKGRGHVYSFSVVRAKTPYVIAYISLVEGLTLLSSVVESAPEAIHIGQPVFLKFETRAGIQVPVFTSQSR